MNRLMTGGQDVRWRRRVIELARLKSSSSLLDLGTGTGDLAREALSQFPQASVIGADFTLEMMRVGKQNGDLDFSAADALHLPFHGGSFDAVVSGFLMRNVIDLQKAIHEQHRVLNKGGRVVILDTTRPKKNFLSPLLIDDIQYQLPFGWIGRLAGRWLVQRKLHRLFDYRHRVTKQACEGDASRPSIKNRSENFRLLEARRFSSR